MRRKRIKYVANIDFGYRSITDAKQHIKTVSYTHLDVYKRQVIK